MDYKRQTLCFQFRKRKVREPFFRKRKLHNNSLLRQRGDNNNLSYGKENFIILIVCNAKEVIITEI